MAVSKSKDPPMEMVWHPSFTMTPGPRDHKHLGLVHKKTGDTDRERFIEERLENLGLLDTKRSLEMMLAKKLNDSLEKSDDLLLALNRAKSSRKRPLTERVTSATQEIMNVIKPVIVSDLNGHKWYKVQILMGVFTKDVSHSIRNHKVTIKGGTAPPYKLTKELEIEFPPTVDTDRLDISFNAGVFRLAAPFFESSHRLRRDSEASTASTSNSDFTVNAALDSSQDDAMSLDSFPERPETVSSGYATDSKPHHD